MLDDIGLGSAIANAVYVFLIVVAIIGFVGFFRKKVYVRAVTWFSVFLNVFLYFFLMGRYIDYPHFLYTLINTVWPLLNIVLIIISLINLIKNKNVKTK